jgi:hypothetical protein
MTAPCFQLLKVKYGMLVSSITGNHFNLRLSIQAAAAIIDGSVREHLRRRRRHLIGMALHPFPFSNHFGPTQLSVRPGNDSSHPSTSLSSSV